MKKLTLIIILFSCHFCSGAKCGFAGIYIWPQDTNIATNPIFVIEGYSQSQQLIENLGYKSRVYLTNSKDTINLNILRVLEGQFSLTQAILKPVVKLNTGLVYELHIDSLGDFDEYEVQRFKVTEEVDTLKPLWSSEPQIRKKSYVRYGCGPSKTITFQGKYNDKSPVLVYARLFDKTNASNSDYFLQSQNGKLVIGHGMCSGEFVFEKNAEYEIQFGLLDASGNLNMNLTRSITFTPPIYNETDNRLAVVDDFPLCMLQGKMGVWILGIILGLLSLVLIIFLNRKV